MGRRKQESITDVIRRTAPEVFACLSAAGFSGPHDIEDGVAFVGRGFRFRIYLWSGFREVSIDVHADLLAQDGRLRRFASLQQLFVACGLPMPNHHGAVAGSAKVTERRLRWLAARIEELLPSLLSADPHILHRNLFRGFAEPDLRAAARLGRPRRDEARRSPFVPRTTSVPGDYVVHQYACATSAERAAMRAVVTPAGAETLRTWADHWQELTERTPQDRSVDMATLARELAGGPPHASPSASRPVK